MSRYAIRPHTDASLSVVVGFDHPLSTFFANVIRPAAEDDPSYAEDEIVMMIGCFTAEVTTVDKLADIIRCYAYIPNEVREAMERDAQQPYELSPLQVKLRSWGLVQ